MRPVLPLKNMKKKSKKDEFLRITEKKRYEEKVKDSRFIATAAPIESAEEAAAFIAEMKKEFHDATHNCSAWKTGQGTKMKYRYNDDGEPSGTAGLPILKAIDAREISNICVVVTRYFGGTRLGTGGLMRAYGQLAAELLKKCKIEKKYLTQTLEFSVAFDFVSVIHNIVKNFDANLKDSQYGDDVLFIVEVRSSEYSNFRTKLTEATNGQTQFK